MTTLTDPEIASFLELNPPWSLEDGKIVSNWRFPDFVAAIAFVNRVADIAEQAQHHPDIDIRYNQVKLALVTHDAGGVTRKDADMAKHLVHLLGNEKT